MLPQKKQKPPQKNPAPISDEARAIGEALNEPQLWLIQRAIDTLGLERTQALFQKTVEIEAAEGMVTNDESRRRTPGGVFFKLVKENTTKDERRAVFPYLYPRPRMPWPEAWKTAYQLAKTATPERTHTMYTSVAGIPHKVSRMKECIALVLTDTPARDVPQGLPLPPENTKHTVIVFIAYYQWDRVKEKAQNGIQVRGVFVPDPKNKVSIILAQQVRPLHLVKTLEEKAQKKKKAKQPATASPT